MMLAGIVMTKVGERPLQSVVMPSFRAILRKPSKVELYVFFCTSCTAQSAPEATEAAGSTKLSPLGTAMHSSAELPWKKTSRQQAVTPSSAVCAGVSEPVRRASFEKSTADVGVLWDCRRTRTTSSGVTVWLLTGVNQHKLASWQEAYQAAT
jgi:hypothetical protein